MSELYNDRDYFDRMFANIDDNFLEIKSRLDKLNGNVSRHETIINENLPHNISHCVQTETIKRLEENMITEKTIKKTIYILFGLICALIAAIIGVFQMMK
jgi:hypothetical protein